MVVGGTVIVEGGHCFANPARRHARRSGSSEFDQFVLQLQEYWPAACDSQEPVQADLTDVMRGRVLPVLERWEAWPHSLIYLCSIGCVHELF